MDMVVQGRQFLWKTIIYALRSEGRIVLAVASSGIASSLLPSSRTAHSRFKLPTLKDILDTPTKLFGVKTVMLGGDFRHTFPVKKSAPRHEIITSSIVSSYLWRSFRLFPLSTVPDRKHEAKKKALVRTEKKSDVFAEWLLNVGDGVLGTPDEHDPENTSWVEIPDIYRILDDENGVTNLIRFIYDNHTLLYPTAKDLQEKAIVCPRNDTVDTINATIMNTLPGTLTKYISYDEALPHGHDRGKIELLYPVEYLNTLNFPRIPPHELELKIGTPIMLLRNINIIGGLCNGTQMIVTQLLPKVIEEHIITGTGIS
ncbi:DNA helicase [Tanacetum coccineum]